DSLALHHDRAGLLRRVVFGCGVPERKAAELKAATARRGPPVGRPGSTTDTTDGFTAGPFAWPPPSAIATLFLKPTIQLQRLCSLGRVRFEGSSSPPLPVRGTDLQQESSRGVQPPLKLLRLLQKETHLLAWLTSSKNSTQMSRIKAIARYRHN